MENCALCDGKLIKDKRNIKYTRKDKSKIKINMSGLYCDDCGESFHDDEDLKDFQKQIQKK